MKKLLSVILIAALAASLASCGLSKNPEDYTLSEDFAALCIASVQKNHAEEDGFKITGDVRVFSYVAERAEEESSINSYEDADGDEVITFVSVPYISEDREKEAYYNVFIDEIFDGVISDYIGTSDDIEAGYSSTSSQEVLKLFMGYGNTKSDERISPRTVSSVVDLYMSDES